MQKNNIKKLEKKVEKYLKDTYPQGILIKEFARTNVESRPDYALILPDRIIYIELKGNRDSTNRLDRQMHLYKKLADQVLLFLDKSFSEDIALKYSKMGIGVFFYKGKKKELDTRYSYSKFDPFGITDSVKLLFAEELKFLLRDIEGNEFNLNTLENRFIAINATFSRIEIKELSQQILYNRFYNWDQEGRPENFDYKEALNNLKLKIHFLDYKRELFIKCLNDYASFDKNKKITFYGKKD